MATTQAYIESIMVAISIILNSTGKTDCNVNLDLASIDEDVWAIVDKYRLDNEKRY